MPATFFNNPELYRSVLEELPIAVYIVDWAQRVRFWNHAAEQLTGHLAHEAMGQNGAERLLAPCNQNGQTLSGELCPISATLTNGHAQPFAAYFLHKNGHRLAVRVWTRTILENNEAIAGAMVLFEEAFVSHEASSEAPISGCVDAATGISSHQLTRAVLNECMAGREQSHHGFELLRIRVLGLDEFRSRHGIQSALPFLRATARTLRSSVDPENFVGCWGEDEVVLPYANPATTRAAAEMGGSLVTHSEMSWWGERFPVQAVVMHTVAQPGGKLEKLLNGLEPVHAAAVGRALGTANTGA